MSAVVQDIHGIRVLFCAAAGPLIATDRDASDLISLSFTERSSLIAIPVARLSPDFFRLRTGVAGAFIQKLVNYRRRLAVVGDVSQWIAESTAFRDFVYEANKGSDVWSSVIARTWNAGWQICRAASPDRQPPRETGMPDKSTK